MKYGERVICDTIAKLPPPLLLISETKELGGLSGGLGVERGELRVTDAKNNISSLTTNSSLTS